MLRLTGCGGKICEQAVRKWAAKWGTFNKLEVPFQSIEIDCSGFDDVFSPPAMVKWGRIPFQNLYRILSDTTNSSIRDIFVFR